MRDSQIVVLVEPGSPSRGIPHYKHIQPFRNKKQENLSEYKAVYKQWSYQKPRTCQRPQISKHQIAKVPLSSQTVYNTDYAAQKLSSRKDKKPTKGHRLQYQHLRDEVLKNQWKEGKTTYSADFVPKVIQVRKPYTSATEQTYKSPEGTFNGISVYSSSYLKYSPELMKSCKGTPVKPYPASTVLHSNVGELSTELPDPSEIPTIEEAIKYPGTPETAISYKHPEITKAQQAITENAKPIEIVKTENQDASTKKNVPEPVQIPPSSPFIESETMITTTMKDYRPNWVVQKRTPCKPEETNYRDAGAKFNGTTTTKAEYKPWPVSKPEVPLWAKKAEYKGHTEGMNLTTTYCNDYTNPKVVTMVAAMIKPKINEAVVIPVKGEPVYNHVTTYNAEYKEWKTPEQPKSYKVQSVYNPPVDKMECETMYKTCYQGLYSKKAELVRHSSEHRQLNRDKTLYFRTTYKSNYQDFRPKSCPGAYQGTHSVKTAWEDLSEKKNLNISKDSGIDMLDSDADDSVAAK